MAREVWFQLVGSSTHSPFGGTTTVSISSKRIREIDDLVKKVHAHFKGTDTLARVHSSQLKVYADWEAYEVSERLECYVKLGDLGNDETSPIIVEVPEVVTRKVWFQLMDASTRSPLENITTRLIESTSLRVIEDLVNKIFAHFDGTDTIARVHSSQLKVYADREAYEASQQLEWYVELGDLGNDGTSPIIVEVPKRIVTWRVWFQLVDASTRSPLVNVTTRSIESTSLRVIEDLVNKIFAHFDGTDTLARVHSSQLKVYGDWEAYEASERLEWYVKLGDLGQDGTSPIIVEVPKGVVTQKVWFQLVDASTRSPLVNVTTRSIESTSLRVIEDLVNKIFAHFDGTDTLARVHSSQLKVYADREAYEASQRLEWYVELGDLGQDGTSPIIVELPQRQSNVVRAPVAMVSGLIPTTTVLADPVKFREECRSFPEWAVGIVHEIPCIWMFMKKLGGCTDNGKLFWRLEDQQAASLLLDGWFSSDGSKGKQSILIGSPGIGKSTLLCVMAFYLVFEHKMNVLIYRRLDGCDDNCLVDLGYEGDRIVHFSRPKCTPKEAGRIYKGLRERQDMKDAWLLMDGFKYKSRDDVDAEQDLVTFRLLTTAQQVALKSQDIEHSYCCLLSCWRQKDLFKLGKAVHHFEEEDMNERFYYSGGNVREFTRATTEDIRIAACKSVDDAGLDHIGSLRRTFVKDIEAKNALVSCEHWVDVIDSEYTVLTLRTSIRSDELFRIYHWAQDAGHELFAGKVFETCLHRLAVDNMLSLYISEYDPNDPQLEVKNVHLKTGGAICCGTTSDYESHLQQWRDDEKLMYWFPACYDFPNIASIVKLESTSGKTNNVAYLVPVNNTEYHEIDDKQMENMNAIFSRDHVKDAGDTEPPMYIAVCPDLESCKAFALKPRPELLAARKNCRVFVGYCDSPITYIAAALYG